MERKECIAGGTVAGAYDGLWETSRDCKDRFHSLNYPLEDMLFLWEEKISKTLKDSEKGVLVSTFP